MSDSPDLIDHQHAESPLYFGIDVGGTGIKIGLVDSAGRTVGYRKIPTRQPEGPEAAVDRIAQVCRDLGQVVGQTNIRAAGLGAPGPMDLDAGTLIQPPQLPSWWGFNLRDAVAAAIGMPVTFLNDANAAAYGEFWTGTGRDDNSMVLLTLGTGVGGGIVVEDLLVNGENSCGSECGHILVDPSPTARLCVWGGGRGHLEAYASASAVVQRTRQRLTEGAGGKLAGTLAGNDSELTALKVYHAAIEGDELALEIVDETAYWLGIGVTSLVHTIDPGIVVLGGAMNFGGDGDPIGTRFLRGVRETFRSRTFENVFEGTRIRFASLGGHAGYLGVAGYAKKQTA
ncbi:MAG: ROK family protein [Planctomycetota bacterium]